MDGLPAPTVWHFLPGHVRGVIMENTMKRKAMEPVRNMPELRHSIEGEPFSLDRSEVVNWLMAQPEVRQTVFNLCKEGKLIVFDQVTNTWKGNRLPLNSD